MEKTSVYLSDDDRRRLAHLARRTGRSQAAIIREAIAAYEPNGAREVEYSLTGLIDGPEGSIADDDQSGLLDGFGE